MTRYVKVVSDPLRTADYINAEMITEITPVYDSYRGELKCINISTAHRTYDHYIGRKMSVDEANSFVEKIIYCMLDPRDIGNIIHID